MINKCMNYENHYNTLIARAKNRILNQDYETHHIVPRCIGGTDEFSNLVRLTPEEHYTAHLLLVKIHNHPKLIYAAQMMTVGNKYTRRNNKMYGWLKRQYIELCRQRTGKNNGSFGKSWYNNPVTMENGKFANDAIPEGWIKGRKIKKELKPRKTTKCVDCSKDTNSYKANWCKNCRHTGPVRQEKQKMYFSDEEKINALKLFDGKIRPALFHLGLNDSGTHYRYMKKLKASLYPLATNQLKG